MIPSSSNTCKLCGKANAARAEFCAYCGSKLTPPDHGRLTLDDAAEWSRYMKRYEFYASLWTPGGAGTRNHYKCMLMQPVSGERAWPGPPVLIIPILERDWCLRLVEWQGRKTTAGELIVGAEGLGLYDLAARQSWRIRNKGITSVILSIHWVLDISFGDREQMRLVVKRGGARVSLYRSAEELLESENPESALDWAEHPADARGRIRFPPRTWDDEKTAGDGVTFWTELMLFLAQGVER